MYMYGDICIIFMVIPMSAWAVHDSQTCSSHIDLMHQKWGRSVSYIISCISWLCCVSSKIFDLNFLCCCTVVHAYTLVVSLMLRARHHTESSMLQLTNQH